MGFDKNGNWVYDMPSVGLGSKYSAFVDPDPAATMKAQVDGLTAQNLQAHSNDLVLTAAGVSPDKIGQSYTKNMTLGSDGNLYDPGFADEVNQAIAEKNVMAGPTQANADLLNQNNDSWGYKEWGTAGNLGLGLGQLGLGIASYLENQKTANVQRRLLKQQYGNNADLIEARKAKRDNTESVFRRRA